MAFDITCALIMGVILFFMLRRSSGGAGWLVIAGALFGFFLAGTGVHGAVHNTLHSLVINTLDWVRSRFH